MLLGNGLVAYLMLQLLPVFIASKMSSVSGKPSQASSSNLSCSCSIRKSRSSCPDGEDCSGFDNRYYFVVSFSDDSVLTSLAPRIHPQHLSTGRRWCWHHSSLANSFHQYPNTPRPSSDIYSSETILVDTQFLQLR